MNIQTDPRNDPGASPAGTLFTPIPGLRPTLSIERLQGMLIGIALGDSLGLAVETLTSQQIAERFGAVTDFLDLDNNKFLEGKDVPAGSCSDDAQLTAAIFRAYLQAGEFSLAAVAEQHVRELEKSTLGWGGSTVAGVEALRAGLLPESPEFRQRLKAGTGNGIPMKIAAVAAWFSLQGVDQHEMVEQVRQISSITHPTSISVSAGLAHVAALLYCLSHTPESFEAQGFVSAVVTASSLGRTIYPETLTGDDLTDRLATLVQVSEAGREEIISSYGGGDCYVYNSLPFSYGFFLRDPAGSGTLLEVINAGGDTDSNAALVGGLQGALAGPDLFPVRLVSRVRGLADLLDLAPRFMALRQFQEG